MALDLKADVLYQYATDVATWQMDRIFSNPLASPDTLGVSSGAAFGAALGILISNNPLAPQAMAVFFGLVAIAATFLLSRIRQDSTVLMIVLGGVITSAFFSAGVSALKYLADPLTKLPEITYWLMGSMVASSYQDVLISLCLIALPVGMMFLLRWKLNVLMLPDDEAASLGVKAKTMRWLIILLGTLIIAASVSVCGQIGWVGLVIPHMARRVVGSDHQYSLPASISIGGTYLMLIDTVSRSLTSSELPLSILTAIIGVPIFVMLFFRKGPALLTLEVKDGCFSYGSHRVLRDVNLKVDSCDIMAILGRNGIGKTTLLKCIMGMLPWQSGGAYLDGVDIRTIPQRQLWRDVAYVPQAKNAFDYPVRDMIVMGRSSHIGTFGKPGAADYEIADSIVERLGIQSFAHKSCTQLSGGQLQLVLIGRALASEPKILIMDEPESNLDYHNQLHVLDLVKEIAKTTACVLNTHYPDHALRYANKAFMLLPTGEGIMGTTQEVITQDHLQKAFHINVHVGETQIADAYYPYIIPLHTHVGVGV